MRADEAAKGAHDAMQKHVYETKHGGKVVTHPSRGHQGTRISPTLGKMFKHVGVAGGDYNGDGKININDVQAARAQQQSGGSSGSKSSGGSSGSRSYGGSSGGRGGGGGGGSNQTHTSGDSASSTKQSSGAGSSVAQKFRTLGAQRLDYNQDGKININDVQAAIRQNQRNNGVSYGLYRKFAALGSRPADVNGDGKVDLSDVQSLLHQQRAASASGSSTASSSNSPAASAQKHYRKVTKSNGDVMTRIRDISKQMSGGL